MPLGVVMASLTQGLLSPTAILRTLDEAALAANLHILLWVEDLERFARAETNNDPQVASRTYEKLNPIRSLLYQLHELERVCVVVAAQSLDEHFDVEKIARYVERPPRMSVKTAWGIIHELRAGCPKSSLMEGTWRLAQKDMEGEAVRQQIKNEKGVVETIVDIRTAIVELCAQPRMLKTVLRSCLDVYKRINGTIDFDSILLLSVIRAAAPQVFARIERDFWRLATAKYSFVREIVDMPSRPLSEEKRNAVQQIVFVEFFLNRGISAKDEEVLEWKNPQLAVANARLAAAVSGKNPQAPSRPKSYVGPDAEERWRLYLSLSPIASSHGDPPSMPR